MNKRVFALEKGINFSNLFQRHLSEHGDKIAVDDGRNTLTYNQLEKLSDFICDELIKNGFCKGDTFMLITHKETLTIAIIFGILKAGGVFIPTASSTPLQRILLMKADAQCEFVTSELSAEIGGEQGYSLPIEDLRNRVELSDFGNAPKSSVEIDEDDLCYIIYTSGSTGKPKGVPISHLNFMAFIDSMESVYKVNMDSNCLNTIPYHFDASMEDFYSLYQGAYLYITPSITIPSLLLRIIENKKITHIASTPSILNTIYNFAILTGREFHYDHLETIIMGGDICEKKVIEFLFDISPNMELINGYGPSEATCDAITYTINSPHTEDGFLPIGIPLKHIDFLLIDKNQKIIREEGVKGELILSGKQVFSGYLNREEETENSFCTIDGVRYYKTGDICILNKNDDLVFLGRENDELKLNGFRVNLNEIRTVIMNIDFVKLAEIVVVLKEGDKKMYLSAAIELVDNEDASRLEEIPNIIKQYLPFYMLPERYVLYDDFPILASTKIDKKGIKKLLDQDTYKQDSNFYYVGKVQEKFSA